MNTSVNLKFSEQVSERSKDHNMVLRNGVKLYVILVSLFRDLYFLFHFLIFTK